MFRYTVKKAVLLTVLSAFVAGTAGSALAGDDAWAKTHPRRAEVNKRLANQNKRINKEVREGEMSKAKAAKLKRDDRQIRGEERAMAAQNGGHITKTEQKTLNQQENAVGRKIGQ